MGEPVKRREPGAILTSERGDRTARRLRADLTPAETSLWRELRSATAPGFRFRRQTPLGPYVVDFICHQARLVVEVDGGIHRLEPVAARDIERETWLRGRGYRVIRITNEQALFDPSGAVERINVEIGGSTPTPTPPHKGEGLKDREEE